MPHKYYPNPLERVVFSTEGPQPQTLFAAGQVKIIVAGLKAGQKIPIHPEGLSSFHFLEGKGIMIADSERLKIEPGTVIILEEGTPRGMEAETDLKFVAVRITELAN